MHKTQRIAFFCIMMSLMFVLAACANNEAVIPTDVHADAVQTDDSVTLSSIDSEENIVPERVNDEVDTVTNTEDDWHKLVNAHNKFGSLIFQRLLTADSTMENTFLSPTSIALALSMALNGADGDTKTAIANALQLEDFSVEEINAASLALLQALTNANVPDDESDDLGVRLNIANSIWYRDYFTLAEAFRERNAHYYEAEITGLDFNDPHSVTTINSWVDNATEGLITSIVDDIDPELIVLLVNAVYFNGDWTVPFNERLTQNKPFHHVTGEIEDIPMMYQDGTIDYHVNDEFEAVRLPYGKAEQLAMYVMLPKDKDDFTSFVENLTYEKLQQSFSQFAPARGTVTLPRMNVAFRSSLNKVLASLGMEDAFSPQRADFSNMLADSSMDNLHISDVVHQSVLQVDETGTEAAAVTSIEVRTTSMPLYEFHFTADRPFVIAIRDDDTGALLFLGSIVNPADS